MRWVIPPTLWVALCVYMALIFSLSSAPLEDQGPAVIGAHEAVEEAVTVASGGDEAAGESRTPAVEHLLVYAGLGALALAAWSSLRFLPLGAHRWTRAAWRWSLPLAVGLALLYGAFDEWHQGWVAGRSAQWEDVGWDLLGGSIGAGIAFACRWVVFAKVSSWPRDGKAVEA